MASFNERIKEYSSTPTGKIVVIAGPVAVLILIVAVVALSMMNSGGSGGEQAGDVKPLESTATAGTAATSTPEATAAQSLDASEPAVNQDFEVYETRDPFKRPDGTETQSAPVAPPAASASNPVPSTPATGPQSSILFLKGVTNQGGSLYADVNYGAASFVVGSGERIGSSPYQITSISTDSATFLYGDDSLTLSVGQDVQK